SAPGNGPAQPGIAHDADHGQPACIRANRRELAGTGQPEHPPADRVAIGPESARQPFIDDDGPRGCLIVALIEVAAANERRAYRFKVAWRDEATHPTHGGLPWLGNVSLGQYEAGLGVAA